MALNFNDVRPIAQGQWLSIIENVAPSLAEAVQRFPKHVSCPIHGGKDGFRFYKDAEQSGGGVCNTCGAFSDGFSLICWANGWQLPDALKAVANYLGLDEHNIHEVKPIKKRSTPILSADNDPKTIERKRNQLNAVKQALVALDDPQAKPVIDYFINRGLAESCLDMPCDVFFHPALSYWEDGKGHGQHPAMVALIRSCEGKPISYHRTYLTHDGHKANVPTVKKMMPPALPGATKGAAIQLYPVGDELILAEGIETALALHLSLNKPCWACISAGGLEAVQLPTSIKRVIIGADNDQSGVGQQAAQTLAKRLLNEIKGIQVKIIIPEHAGMDWLDVFNGQDKAA